MTVSSPTGSPMATRAALSSVAGSALEWLDFAAYGAIAATVLPRLFFPAADPTSATLAAFATFSVGFIARPLGGLVCGYLGDRLGRRRMLVFTFILMGVCSFLIGVLPTYASVGAWAPLALVSLRFAQGFALGGEVTGSQLLTMEHAPPERRGFYSSFIAMGSPLAQVLANALLFGVAALMSSEQFDAIGWRVPFLFSFVLVALGLYIRMKVSETPAFEQRQQAPAQVAAHIPTMLRLALVWVAPSVGYFIAAVYSLNYAVTQLGLNKQTAFGILIVAHLCSMLAMAAGGLLADRRGRRRSLLLASSLMLVAMASFFPLVATGHPLPVALGTVALLCAVQLHAGIQPAYFAEAFPAAVRYRGSAVGYNLANLLGSCAPLLATWLNAEFAGAWWPMLAVGIALNLLSLAAIYRGPEAWQPPLGTPAAEPALACGR
ncbi:MULTISPECIES: MFS transporter [unclassified Pseudomonas]|uniref:MFS transporter n=1 Tax=unclassified Pseudomonas TaxID=196821 RepID=UPI000BC70526|nr:MULTISPECIES: MFS transporter [unclassified Pseudomonas]PVZ20445.1 MFS transporter [Pseudomonas sp. URIL14HWK12:I12]PVZ27511.1 MFS transporter [Pseudomonas sp. URIL14HWK12:I10]PVZ38400.1 MFS transporter [Pseudomonas sp. URIL14HWK12:I11]SNZ03508.1 Arabinose efflux permease [Pseudomonas sp. URIL14HWK12:I9]